MFYYERKFRKKGFDFIIGVDEAGRGPLAGPVVAGAVILKKKRFKNRIDDSKKLSHLQRQKAFFEIADNSIFSIGVINEGIIDRLNILQATRLAMENAIYGVIQSLSKLKRFNYKSKEKIFILVDGNVKLNIEYPYLNIIKGDNRSKSVAAASIVAKFMRDRIMSLYAKIYPKYGFLQHKGYPTSMHRRILRRYGPTMIHRQTFLKCLRQV